MIRNTQHPRLSRRRAGMTFLEVVFAFALLGVVSAAMFGMFTFITGTQLRQQRLLACSEVANRLMLQYLDEPTGMPPTSKPVEYGPKGAPARFRWEYAEEPVEIIEALAENRDESRQQVLPKDRFRQVSIRVWLSEESGGSRFAEGSTPSATITRMVDPMAPRNPDSFMNMLQNPDAFRGFMESMMGFQGTTIRGGTAQPRPNPGQGNQQQRPNRTEFGPGGMNPQAAFRRGSRSGGNRFNTGRFGSGNARPAGLGGNRPGGGNGGGGGGPR